MLFELTLSGPPRLILVLLKAAFSSDKVPVLTDIYCYLLTCGGFCFSVQWTGTDRNGPVRQTERYRSIRAGTVKDQEWNETEEALKIPVRYRSKGPVFDRFSTDRVPVVVPVLSLEDRYSAIPVQVDTAATQGLPIL